MLWKKKNQLAHSYKRSVWSRLETPETRQVGKKRFPPLPWGGRLAAATPVFLGNKLSCLGSLSVMRFATVNAGVSVYGQGTVAGIYSQRTVADIDKYSYEL